MKVGRTVYADGTVYVEEVGKDGRVEGYMMCNCDLQDRHRKAVMLKGLIKACVMGGE